MVCIYPRLKSLGGYKPFGSKSINFDVVGLCEHDEEATAELIIIYDSLIVSIHGDEVIYTEGGTKIFLKKGECAFVPKGALITATAFPVNGKHKGGVISFPQEILKEYNLKICNSTENLILSNNPTKKITHTSIALYLATFEPLIDFKESQATPLINSKLLELLLLLEKSEELKFFRSGTIMSRAERVTLISDLDISESVTLEEMSKRLGLSLSTFKRDFKKTFNESAKQWLIKKKIEKAHFLLITTGKSIKEISIDCGFSDSSHFIKHFKRTYGCSPGALSKVPIKIHYT